MSAIDSSVWNTITYLMNFLFMNILIFCDFCISTSNTEMNIFIFISFINYCEF